MKITPNTWSLAGLMWILIVDATGFLLCVGMLHLLEVFKGFALLLLQPVSGLVRLSQMAHMTFALTTCCWMRA